MTTSTPDVLLPNEVPARIETSVTTESGSHFFLGALGDVASGGVFVAGARDLCVGQRVRVEIALHSYVVVFRGTVRWRRADGVGVGFENVSGSAMGVIESFCARRRPAVGYDAEGNALTRD